MSQSSLGAALDPAIVRDGKPGTVTVDKCMELASCALAKPIYMRGIALDPVRPFVPRD